MSGGLVYQFVLEVGKQIRTSVQLRLLRETPQSTPSCIQIAPSTLQDVMDVQHPQPERRK